MRRRIKVPIYVECDYRQGHELLRENTVVSVRSVSLRDSVGITVVSENSPFYGKEFRCLSSSALLLVSEEIDG